MAKEDFATITIYKKQAILAEELGDSLWGKKHGNKTRFVRMAIDKEIERIIIEREKNSKNESN
jgi:hypothetical protein